MIIQRHNPAYRFAHFICEENYVIQFIGICDISAHCFFALLGGSTEISLDYSVIIQLLFLYELECEICCFDFVYNSRFILQCSFITQIFKKIYETNDYVACHCSKSFGVILF